jgi:NADH-quinone oxidoreductase subunit L
MFLAAGLGLFGVAVFHLVTHSFFKALLFLGAGAVMHSVHGQQDMRQMGGLRRKIPRTAAVFTLGAAALAGFPLTSGFFSKDEILHGAWGAAGGGDALKAGWLVLWGVGIVTAGLTALYAFRQVSLVFLEPRSGARDAGGRHENVHESPPSMMVPLYVLAALSLLGGLLPVPVFLSNEFLASDLPSHGAAAAHASGKLLGWLIGGTVSLAGIACAFALFVWASETRERALETSRVLAWLAALSFRKFYVDELYNLAVVRPFRALSLVLFYVVDRLLIDWIFVAGAALLVKGAGATLRRLQPGRIPAYTALFLLGVLGLLALAFWSIR